MPAVRLRARCRSISSARADSARPPRRVREGAGLPPSEPHPAGLLVTGTDTGAGKTVLCASLAAAIASAGRRVIAHKPVLTGTAQPAPGWRADDELLAEGAGMPAAEVAPLRLAAPASPHLACRLQEDEIDFDAVLARTRAVVAEARAARAALVIEGVGGLLVPLTDDRSVRDLACAVRLPLLIAARPGLGTINHTLLTLEAARAADLEVLAVVLTPWPRAPDAIQRSNRETIERLGQVEVRTLARVAEPRRAELAAAGQALPWRRWLAEAARRAEPDRGGPYPRPARAAATTPAQTEASSSSSITYAGIV